MCIRDSVHGTAANGVQVKVHTRLAQTVNFCGDHVFGQTERRNAIDEHPTGLVQGDVYKRQGSCRHDTGREHMNVWIW